MPKEATPTLVVVSGHPGSGKTTLAHAVAGAIPCPALCRDELKEGMAHAAGPGFQGGPGDPLTLRTLPLFFDLLQELLAAGVTVVAEAAFQNPIWSPRLEPLTELARLRIIRCQVDAVVSFERAARRASGSESRRQAHGDSTVGIGLSEWEQKLDSFEHISLSAPALDVDTTGEYEPGLAAIVDFVNRN